MTEEFTIGGVRLGDLVLRKANVNDLIRSQEKLILN